MTVHASADEAHAVSPTIRTDPKAVLPLHAELYLLAHDDDTGKLLINEQALALGLAGALLLELWMKEFVAVGYAYNEFTRQWRPESGRLTVCQYDPVGNTLLDAALTAVARTARTESGENQLRAWLRSYAAADLYERTRASLVAVGLLQRSEVRRLGGLLKSETYLPVHYGYAVRARAHVKDAVTYHSQRGRHRYAPPDDEYVALCGLIAALELAEYLYDQMPTRDLTPWLRHVVNAHENPAITAVVQAVDAGRGDLAVAAMG